MSVHMTPFDGDGVAAFFSRGHSLARSYMNEAARNLQIEGRVLDLGSGRFGSSGYHTLITELTPSNHVSLDLSRTNGPAVVGDLEEGLPFKNEAFASCLAFNIFEHTYRVGPALKEVHRVLAQEGHFHLAVPFLIRVHGDPHDFFRYTAEALERLLSEAGFTRIKIRSCGSGALVAALAQVDFAVPRFLRRLAFFLCSRLDRVIASRSSAGARTGRDYPVAYVVSSRRG